MTELPVHVEQEPNRDDSRYGLLITVKVRETSANFKQRAFTFKNELKGLLRLVRYVAALKELHDVNPKTHYIEIRPTLRHKNPKWLLKQLGKHVKIEEAINHNDKA